MKPWNYIPAHPVSEVAAAFYHRLLAGLLFIGVAFHTYAALALWRDRGESLRPPRDYADG